METTYSKTGDYLLPNLTVPSERHKIGKYGMLRRSFLKEHHQPIYSIMMMNGTLLKHLAEIDEMCQDELDRIIPNMAKNEGVTENLKAANQMEWVRCMNSIKNRAEEV